MARQTCEHAFCRILKFLFYSLGPETAGDSFFTDPASKETLFKMDKACRSFAAHGKNFQEKLVIPVLRGDPTWVKNGEYTPVGRSREHASPVDFFRLLRSAMLDESIVIVPARGVPTTSDELLEESLSVKVESYRPTLFVENAEEDESNIGNDDDDDDNDSGCGGGGDFHIIEQEEEEAPQQEIDIVLAAALSSGVIESSAREPVASTSNAADTAADDDDEIVESLVNKEIEKILNPQIAAEAAAYSSGGVARPPSHAADQILAVAAYSSGSEAGPSTAVDQIFEEAAYSSGGEAGRPSPDATVPDTPLESLVSTVSPHLTFYDYMDDF